MLEESFSSCETLSFSVWIEWLDVQLTLLDKKISQKIAIFKGKYTFGLYQLIFGTYLNVLQ